LHSTQVLRVLSILIYLSVLLGIPVLYFLYHLVPVLLFYSVLIGWIAYLITAAGLAVKRKVAILASFFLAFTTLVVSLPVPAHYTLVGKGEILPALTFLAGSVLQLAIVILVPLYLLMKHRERHRPEVSRGSS
jgi:hypothetical protein